ncbi:MAG: GNAT family N-acetyltransferase [Sphingobacteriaceae bacterium]|nr:MAG: GNAT family N-acetyltransferase [Sphingobacteriaceae bacterium]
MSNISIEQIRHELTWRLRRDVLYPEKVLHEVGIDEDLNGMHFGAFTDNNLVAVVSLFHNDDEYQFRKFAVSPAYQGKGIGSMVLEYITEFAQSEGGTRIWCNARVTAINFYIKHGFAHTGNTFTRDGYDYEVLTKSLS